MQLFTMGDVARASLNTFMEERIYKTFCINAELIINHAWGWELVTMDIIKQYRLSTTSLSSGQVLHCHYDFEKGQLIAREMTELLAQDMVRKHVVTQQVVLNIGYDRESLTGNRRRNYSGPVALDHYGRKVPRHAHGTGNIDHYTSSARVLTDTVVEIYNRVVHNDLLIRRVNIAVCNLIPEDEIPHERPVQMDMFTDYEEIDRNRWEMRAAEERERKLQRITLAMQDKYGKNAILKGMNLVEGGTTIERNGQIGGHKAGED